MSASIFNPQFIIDLVAHVQGKYVSLTAIEEKLGLTAFTLFSPANLSKLDGEISANPNIVNEAVSLLEFCDLLSFFYSSERLSNAVRDVILQSRTTSKVTENDPILNRTLMREYFTDESLAKFLDSNPGFVGLYIHLFVINASS